MNKDGTFRLEAEDAVPFDDGKSQAGDEVAAPFPIVPPSRSVVVTTQLPAA